MKLTLVLLTFQGYEFFEFFSRLMEGPEDLIFTVWWSCKVWVCICFWACKRPPMSHKKQINNCVLSHHYNDLDYFIEKYQGTFIGCGSEFHPDKSLKLLLGHHCRWTKFLKLLTEGLTWPLSKIHKILCKKLLRDG